MSRNSSSNSVMVSMQLATDLAISQRTPTNWLTDRLRGSLPGSLFNGSIVMSLFVLSYLSATSVKLILTANFGGTGSSGFFSGLRSWAEAVHFSERCSPFPLPFSILQAMDFGVEVWTSE